MSLKSKKLWGSLPNPKTSSYRLATLRIYYFFFIKSKNFSYENKLVSTHFISESPIIY